MKNRYIVVLGSFIFLSIDAVPYRFTRLVSEHNGQINKVVDFFYDFHRDFSLPPKHPSTRGRKFLKPDEQKLFDAPLRGFISSIRELDSKANQKIGLLWEYQPEGAMEKYHQGEGLTLEEKELKEKTGAYIFLGVMGNTFNTEFAPGKNKNIVFIPSDTYRKKEMIDYLDASKITPDAPLQEVLQPMIDIAKNQSAGDQAMLRLKEQLPTTKYHYLEQKWTSFQKELKRMMSHAFIPAAPAERTTQYSYKPKQSQDQIDFIFPTIGVHEYLAKRKLLQEKYQDAVFKLWNKGITNFEILFNLLLSPYRHNIIYAGGNHAEKVIDMLEQLGFKKIVDVGTKKPYFIQHNTQEIQPFRLQHNALRFLFEQPGSKPFNRYLRNPLEKIEDPEKLGNTLVKIFLLDQKNETRTTTLENKDFQDLKKLVTQTEKSYVDITNVIIDGLPMVELLISYGQFAMAEYLMQHGALFSTLAFQETLDDYAEWKKTGKQSWYEYFINKVKAVIDAIPGSG